jgi:hypothetical protein
MITSDMPRWISLKAFPRDEARRHVGDEHGNEERGDPVGPPLEVDLMLLLERSDSPDAAAHDDAEAVGRKVRPTISAAGALHRLGRSDQG